MVHRLNAALGLPETPWIARADGKGSRAQVGNIHLDHNIGGWQVQQMFNDGGGVTCPFGDFRLTASECYFVLRGALGAVELAKQQTTKQATP